MQLFPRLRRNRLGEKSPSDYTVVMTDNNISPKSSLRLEEIMKQVGKQSYPPVHLWNPDFCGDIDMVIKKDGSWFYMGTPIARERMVKLFSTILRKDDDGKTYMVTPVEKIGITVEDAPFVATNMEVSGDGDDGAISFTTNVGDVVMLDGEHPLRVEVNEQTGEPRPYVLVRGQLEALINRSVFYELVDMAEHQDNHLVIKSAGKTFSLGVVS